MKNVRPTGNLHVKKRNPATAPRCLAEVERDADNVIILGLPTETDAIEIVVSRVKRKNVPPKFSPDHDRLSQFRFSLAHLCLFHRRVPTINLRLAVSYVSARVKGIFSVFFFGFVALFPA